MFKKLFICLFLILCPLALSLELNQSVKYDRGKTSRTEQEKTASYIAYDLLKENGVKVSRLLSLTNAGESSTWYVLSKNLELYGVDITDGQVIGKWPVFEKNTLCNTSSNCTNISGSKFDGIEQQLLLRYNNHGANIEPKYHANATTLGCLGSSPLKYGDIEEDGASELVLFIENTLIIFSTQLNKVVFMVMVDVNDWLTAEQTNDHYRQHRADGAPSKPQDAQYQSRIATLGRGGDHASLPGYRGYAKLYFGDFDGDKSSDILVWRKLFESNLVENSNQGFSKISEMLVHYKKVNGIYEKQETDSPTIAIWLSTADLTWAKGFPNQSECEGQEGQLIPEMHDPLLNDPEVLPPATP